VRQQQRLRVHDLPQWGLRGAGVCGNDDALLGRISLRRQCRLRLAGLYSREVRAAGVRANMREWECMRQQ
jgi:hypothetical protein